MASGSLEVEEALEICRQIVEALEAAHERGIIHRDLKPANVQVTPGGKVKVLDFGLAKAFEASEEASGPDLSHSPTITAQGTRSGVILGTAAYMSPEQARGKSLDKRTDIWSFGCVIYEALTGRQVFEGETVSDTMAAILKEEPDWETLPQRTPGIIRHLLQRCLQKDPNRRYRDIGDARLDLEQVLTTHEWSATSLAVTTNTLRSALWKQIFPWSLAILMTLIAVSIAVWDWIQPTPSTSLARFIVAPPSSKQLVETIGPIVAIVPDGTRFVYVGLSNRGRQLYIWAMDQLEAGVIPGTEEASTSFFSPDGQWLGFLAEGKLKKIRLAGGLPLTIAEASGDVRGAASLRRIRPVDRLLVARRPVAGIPNDTSHN